MMPMCFERFMQDPYKNICGNYIKTFIRKQANKTPQALCCISCAGQWLLEGRLTTTKFAFLQQSSPFTTLLLHLCS